MFMFRSSSKSKILNTGERVEHTPTSSLYHKSTSKINVSANDIFLVFYCFIICSVNTIIESLFIVCDGTFRFLNTTFSVKLGRNGSTLSKKQGSYRNSKSYEPLIFHSHTTSTSNSQMEHNQYLDINTLLCPRSFVTSSPAIFHTPAQAKEHASHCQQKLR